MPSQRGMNITTWNARGLNAHSKKRLVKHNLKSLELDIIIIQETKLSTNEAIKLDKMLGIWDSFFQESAGVSRGLGVIRNPRKVSLSYLNCSSNWISTSVNNLKSNL